MPLRSHAFVRGVVYVDYKYMYFYNFDVRIVSMTGIGHVHEFKSRCSRSLGGWPHFIVATWLASCFSWRVPLLFVELPLTVTIILS